MLRSSYPRVDWDRVRVVGFDLDGTLYDEAEFIAQVYRPIAAIIARAAGGAVDAVYPALLRRWHQMGSSYSQIFAEALAARGVEGPAAEAVIKECVATFRGFAPDLNLPSEVRTILDGMRGTYPLFLVSDGSVALQQRKFTALGLDRWFGAENVGFSATLGAGFDKPDTRVLSGIQVLLDHPPGEVVFFGDRDNDERFAANAGFQFVRVRCMVEVTPIDAPNGAARRAPTDR
jgi:FMN phosphatase YigB (HAD superfamily)